MRSLQFVTSDPMQNGGKPDGNRLPLIGIGLSVVWLLLILLFWIFAPQNPDAQASGITRAAAYIGIFMPFAMIWAVVLLAGRVLALRGEADELRMQVLRLQDNTAARSVGEPIPQAAAYIRPSQPKSATAKPAAPQQTTMRFDAPEIVEITPETLIRALNFPDDANDQAAITAMRTALKERELARVIRAAQDVITLLAEQEITMDGIAPDHANAAIWRRFANGERGAAIAVIGNTQSEIALEIVTTLLRGDEIFRDSSHHFLRHFDQILSRNAATLDDAELEALVDTRSARAFILLGKASGSFG